MNGYKTLQSRVDNLSVKVEITILILLFIFVRIGSTIPLPFINTDFMREFMHKDGLGFLNAMTGHSMQSMSLFALSIGPYITSSIIIQLLSVAIPSLEEKIKEGKTGQDFQKKITRYTAFILGFIQALAMAIGLGKSGLFKSYNIKVVILAVIIWTIGDIILILIGEFIDLFKMGNGISILLTVNIVSSIPSDIKTINEVLMNGNITKKITLWLIVGLICIGVIYLCVYLNSIFKNITVNYAKGGGKYGITKVNNKFTVALVTCGVMPIKYKKCINQLNFIKSLIQKLIKLSIL